MRNFCMPADEVGLRQRSSDYTKLDDPLAAFGADTFLCFFGYNESFAGAAGVEKFKADYAKFLDDYASYTRATTLGPRRASCSSRRRPSRTRPMAFCRTAGRENANLKLYAAAVAEVAKERGLAFVDLFAPTAALFAQTAGSALHRQWRASKRSGRSRSGSVPRSRALRHSQSGAARLARLRETARGGER